MMSNAIKQIFFSALKSTGEKRVTIKDLKKGDVFLWKSSIVVKLVNRCVYNDNWFPVKDINDFNSEVTVPGKPVNIFKW